MTIPFILKKYSENLVPYFSLPKMTELHFYKTLNSITLVVNCVYILALSIRQHGGQVD